MKRIILYVITLYQKMISPWFGRACRYQPTCSDYAKQVIRKYGMIKGLWKAAKRILKCNPLFPGGYDPA